MDRAPLSPSRWRVWLLAARPKTLPAAAAPVVMGSAMAFADGVFSPPAALAALMCALLLQIGANLVNDYADFKKGADNPGRVGPLRVTQAGLVSPARMKRAIFAVFAAAAVIAIYPVIRGGWPIALTGAAAILAAVFYTAGPRPYGYIGLGDLFVLIFFGPVAVAGTYYIQALTAPWPVIAVGFGPGLLSAAILTVNNIRDAEGDALAGKRTLAVRWGTGYAMAQYYFCIIGAALTPVVLALAGKGRPLASAAALTLFFSFPPLRAVLSGARGPAMNRALGQTGQLLLIYALLFSLGWLLP